MIDTVFENNNDIYDCCAAQAIIIIMIVVQCEWRFSVIRSTRAGWQFLFHGDNNNGDTHVHWRATYSSRLVGSRSRKRLRDWKSALVQKVIAPGRNTTT